jgi:hypothetical protein
VIATEASNLLPLFPSSTAPCPYPRSFTLDSCFRSVAATRWHVCCISYHPPRFPQTSLRIGLRCLRRPRCRAPARISGKDFPLHSCTGCNQPPLMFFFSSFLSSLSAPHAFRSHGHHPFFAQILGFLKSFHTALYWASRSSAFSRNRTGTKKCRCRCVGSGACLFLCRLRFCCHAGRRCLPCIRADSIQMSLFFVSSRFQIDRIL